MAVAILRLRFDINTVACFVKNCNSSLLCSALRGLWLSQEDVLAMGKANASCQVAQSACAALRGRSWLPLVPREPTPGDQFGDLLIRSLAEKSVGATGFEPAT
jgi:hypothetical protein